MEDGDDPYFDAKAHWSLTNNEDTLVTEEERRNRDIRNRIIALLKSGPQRGGEITKTLKIAPHIFGKQMKALIKRKYKIICFKKFGSRYYELIPSLEPLSH